MIINMLRKNIGTIIASFGFALLCIIVFGNLGEIITEQYWENVKENLTGLGFMSIALTMIQVSIKQGVSEQALQRGLNTENTSAKYKEHRDIIKNNTERMIYMPYFLSIYNERHTMLKKREFLIDNNFSSEESLMRSGNRRLIRRYNEIRIYLVASRIKWATTDIVYNKHGQIITLAEHRIKRTLSGILMGLVFMVGVSLLTKGLFFDTVEAPLYQKFVILGTYLIVITMSSVLSVIREYEKGAFGVPNELEEINEVWREFGRWTIPQWVIDEVENMNKPKEVNDEKATQRDEGGRYLPVKSEESHVVKETLPDSVLASVRDSSHLLLPND